MAGQEMPSALMKRESKTAVVAYVKEECLKNPNPKCLNDMLDTYLDPMKPIDDDDAITWCKWLIAGGPNYEIFAKKVREYDTSVMCGLVWTANFVAYRCRTCAISPCMSLCSDCFQAGNHEGHDYNMFRSQAGGACDCGDVNVMNPAGFCPRHGPENQQAAASPPPELLAVAQAMMPRIFMRLIFYLREISHPDLPTHTVNLSDAEQYLAFLHSLSDMGAAMRHIMTHALIDSAQYKALMKGGSNPAFYESSFQKYEAAMKKLPFPVDPDGFNSEGKIKRRCSSTSDLNRNQIEMHKTILEELVFWMVKCEFPQSIVTLLLGLLPDDTYKEAFTEAFVQHYSRISTVLSSAIEHDTVTNRVVHISVQLFSNEVLATRMVAKHNLLQMVISSLMHLLQAVLMPSTITGGMVNRHMVVECEGGVMKEHCYWPVVSDLINLLSHAGISHSFFVHPNLPTIWMELLTCLQGMNLNQRELSQHVEFEPNTYYAAFSAELEISASPMWSLINHCNAPVTKSYVTTMIKAAIFALEKWFMAIDFGPNTKPNPNQLTFHLPLHRYLAAFLMLAVQEHGINLQTLLPSHSTLRQILLHPLQIQVCLPQIYAGMWVRNGIQIKGQAMTYVQCHFCYSMSDLDLYLLQVCAATLEPDHFLEQVIGRFQLQNWLSYTYDHKENDQNSGQEPSSDVIMLDGALGFLCALFGIRTYLGVSEEELVHLEMASLLCMNDRYHSQLSELMPERSGISSMSRELFEPTLKKLADYKAPSFEAGVGLNQGTYTPKGYVWEQEFDPVHVSQRAIYRKDFQAAMDRYTEYMKTSGKYKEKNSPWPPFRIPGKIHPAYSGIYRILNCPSMHAFLYTVLYKALHEVPTMPDSVLYRTVHLLDLCLHFAPKIHPVMSPSKNSFVKDGNLRNWFHTTDIKANACEVIHKVQLTSVGTHNFSGLDLTNSSLEEMFNVFNMHPSKASLMSGPITAAQTGQIPSISMVSMPPDSDNLSYAMDTSSQPLTNSPDTVKPKYQSHSVTAPIQCQEVPEKFLGESLISILIKLHDKMAGPGVIYKPASIHTAAASATAPPTVLGNGAYYLSRLLNQLNKSSIIVSQHIQKMCQALHTHTEQQTSPKDRSDSKRKKAFSRQQKLMAEFASKQKAFMAQAEEECAVKEMVLGHRQRGGNNDSLTAPPTQEQMQATRCSGILRNRFNQMRKYFEKTSSDLSVNIGWEGGVFVMTCCHYVHLDCQQSYVNTLQNQPQTDTISVSHGEFNCPMCRQLSNSVIPIMPEENKMSVAKPVSKDTTSMVLDLAEMMYQSPGWTNMHIMKNTMDAINNITYMPFRLPSAQQTPSNTFLFISSILRTNLELEVLLRGGTLEQSLCVPAGKKMCLLPLLHLLGMQSKVALSTPAHHTQLWSHVTGVALSKGSSSVSPYKQQVPLLIKDIVALLLQIVLMLPLSMDIEHYLFVVQIFYSALYIQALACISCRFTQDEREAWRKKGQQAPANCLEKWLSFIISQLSSSLLYFEVDTGNTFLAICQSVWSPQSVEASVQDFCLPYLRLAALLRNHIFGPDIPACQDRSEFEMLVSYLNLLPSDPKGSAKLEITGSSCLKWAVADPTLLVQAWCQHVNNLAKIKPAECKVFLNIDDKWSQPHLLDLPERYYQIFSLYRHQTCQRCQRVPKDPALCLVCGAFLCFRENCCMNETTNVFECVEHSILCGAGTGIYLLVNSSIVVVLRGPRATLWGSLYLDQHGEEDRDLKRGKPLFLSRERLEVLENQWLTHSFEHSCKRWIWHRDRL